MFRKHMIFSLGGIALCLMMLAVGLMMSGPGHSHAASSLGSARTPSISHQLAQPFDAVQGNIYYGTGSTSVYALDAQTGAQLWVYPLQCGNGMNFFTVLWVVNGIAYVNTCNPSCLSHLAAIRGSDGTQLWCSTFTFFAPGANGTRFLGVSQGIVYLYTVIPGGDGGEHDTLHALNATDGSLLWSYDQNPQIPDQFLDFFKVVQGVAYISMDQYNPAGGGPYLTCALNTSSGSVNWCAANALTSILAQGVLYATNSTSLIALRASDGSQLWSYAGSFDQIVAHPKVVFVGGPGSLCALNSSNGSQRWCSSVNAYHFFVQGGIIYAGGQAFSASTGALLWTNQAANIIGLGQSVVYALTGGYYVEEINAMSGSLLWSYSIAQSGTASFSPGDGVIYYNTPHGLRALSASTGTLLWSHFTTSNAILSFQSDSSAIAYVVSNNTTTNSFTLHAYNASNGTLLWQYAMP
ncbi:MAG TPA: PQQ-binding-like beta-propeller repeat protein [Ktedonobacteraceae bacterium]|nr:PQQ-binding-like beta-propeller repeat protein [Ktedonobacteraceae bacterium]